MPLHVKSTTIASGSIPTPAETGTAAQKLRALNQDWATELANGLDALSDFITKLMLYLKTSPPTVTQVKVSDATTGQFVTVLGTYIPLNTGVPIINFFSQLSIYDNPDPTAATYKALFNAGVLLMQSIATPATFIHLSPTGLRAETAVTDFTDFTVNGVSGQVGGVGFAITTTALSVGGLPNANPGAGTKQFWYDPADGNRVKFAP